MQPTKKLAECFQAVIGQKPWQAKLGWGSFLTFEFGPKVFENGHVHGTWHLWIYQCEWQLLSRGKALVHSESNKHAIELAVKRLELTPFDTVEFDSNAGQTRFIFGNFELQCRPYSDPKFEKDVSDSEYWLFYMPEHQVLVVGRDNKPIVRPSNRPVKASVS